MEADLQLPFLCSGFVYLRSPQNQNLSKMREVLKYGIFDISSMST